MEPDLVALSFLGKLIYFLQVICLTSGSPNCNATYIVNFLVSNLFIKASTALLLNLTPFLLVLITSVGLIAKSAIGKLEVKFK